MIFAGFPVLGNVYQGSYVYYQFVTSKFNTSINIALTMFTGDADIFVSTKTPTPGYFNTTWAGVSLGNEVIVISNSDPNFIMAPATYYIGVYGWQGNCSFTVTAVEMSSKYNVTLVDGQPQGGQTPTGHAISYFTYKVPSPAMDIDILAVPFTNDVDLYVSVTSQFPQATCSVPVGSQCSVQFGTYQYSSVSSGIADFVTVPKAALTPGQTIIIAVFASTPAPNPGDLGPPSSFSVTASTIATVTQLQDGVPTAGGAGPKVYKYYTFATTTDSADLVVSATVDIGTSSIAPLHH
jgi:hypothetical protein